MEPNLESISAQLGIALGFLIILVIWTLIWKGFALWKAARLNKPIWFVAILVINTFGILEILYLFVFSKMNLGKIDKSIQKTIRKKRRK